MKMINQVVLIFLLVLGLIMAVGVKFNMGGLLGFSTFVGWFFGVFALIAYVISSSRFLISSLNDFWSTLYPVNFGLTLIGVSIMGMDVKQEMMLLLLFIVICSIISFLFYRFGLLSKKGFPFIIFALLCLPAVPELTYIWSYYYFILGVVLINLFMATKITNKRIKTGHS